VYNLIENVLLVYCNKPVEYYLISSYLKINKDSVFG